MISLIGSISVPPVLLSITVQSVNKCFLYLCGKKLAPGEIWTHIVRAGVGTTIIRVSVHLPSTPTLVTWLLEVAVEWQEKSWLESWMKNWDRVGFEHTPLEYRESYATLCVIMLPPSTPSLMSLLPSIASPIQEKYWNIHWQILRPGEIWTHTRRITWMCHCFMRNDIFP